MVLIQKKEGFSGERALVLPQSVIKDLLSDPFYSILYITDIGYYPKAQYHFINRKQPIDQFVFIYCVEGNGWYQIGNGPKRKVKGNQLFILPAHVPHSYGSEENDPWTIYWIHFKGDLASYFNDKYKYTETTEQELHARISNRIELFEEIFRILEMGYSHENLLYACSIFYHFLGTICFLRQYQNAVMKADNNDLITTAIHFMCENLEKKTTLNEIAEHVGYSPTRFSVLFKQRTGYAPLTYFNQLKIQKACQLLDFTEMKINQICYKVGIDDSYYFSRLFKKIMGTSPKEYRKIKKG